MSCGDFYWRSYGSIRYEKWHLIKFCHKIAFTNLKLIELDKYSEFVPFHAQAYKLLINVDKNQSLILSNGSPLDLEQVVHLKWQATNCLQPLAT